MRQTEKKHHRQSLQSSFVNAAWGIKTAFLKERNLKIHVIVMLAVILMGWQCAISKIEWCLCILLFALVISAELMNSAVEAVVDLITQEKHPLARLAKDTAAGGVLVCATAAVIIGVIIFGEDVIHLLKGWIGYLL